MKTASVPINVSLNINLWNYIKDLGDIFLEIKYQCYIRGIYLCVTQFGISNFCS